MSTALRKGTKAYTDRQRLEAVTTYLMLGSIELTAATLRIAPRTLWLWKKTEWWNELVNEVKKEDRLVISSKLRKVLDRSWAIVEERLENGDWMFNQKTGELQRKPVNMRDASQVAFQAAQLFDKMDREDHFVVATEQIEDKLAKLAKSFEALASGKKLASDEVVDVEFTEITDSEEEEEDALYEKGPENGEIGTGLQARESLVQLSARAAEESQ